MPSILPSPPSAAGASPASMFARAMSAPQLQALDDLQTAAQQAPPPDYVDFYCGPQRLGLLASRHAPWLASVLADCTLMHNRMVWDASNLSVLQRSAKLQTALLDLRAQGRVAAWRNEEFSFFTHAADRPTAGAPEFLRIERAGFRFLGLLSHAVHINGFTRDGKIWCGLRSAAKATDPGLWDNVTAGGLAAGESLEECAVRELWEEAGFRLPRSSLLEDAGHARISRPTASGWHDEMLHVYNLPMPDDFFPTNQDGEVQAFACLSAAEVMARIDAKQFTPDAALAIAQSLKSAQISTL